MKTPPAASRAARRPWHSRSRRAHLLSSVLVAAVVAALVVPSSPSFAADMAHQPGDGNTNSNTSHVVLFRPCSGVNASLPIVLLQPAKSSPVVHVWSTTGFPTAAVITFNKPINVSADMSYDCAKLSAMNFPDAIVLKDHEVTQLQSVSFTQLAEYKDDSKKFSFSQDDLVSYEMLDTLAWSMTVDSDTSSALFTSRILTLNLTYHPKEGEMPVDPFNYFTDMSSSIEFVAHNYSFTTNQTSRLAVATIHSGLDGTKMPLKRTVTINDESSPSIFRRTAVESRTSDGNAISYVSWKPVQFGTLKRDVSNMTVTGESAFQSADSSPFRKRIISIAFTDHDQMYALNVTFGGHGDSGLNPSIVAWSAIVGTGEPKTPPMTAALLITIIASFGLPGVAIVLGTIYVFLKKARRGAAKQKKGHGKSTYQALDTK